MVKILHLPEKGLLVDALPKFLLSHRIAEKIAELSDFIYDKTCEAAVCRKDDFNVINHGDFWTNNMMFRYDERQKPTEHTFVRN